MVTTTIDLTVVPTEEGVTILYKTDDMEYAYEGYFSDYESRAFTEVRLPICVESCALAQAYIHSGEAYEVFIQPIWRDPTSDLYIDQLQYALWN